jgi:aminoglycoside 6'-N-acetyltransferase
MGLRLHGELTQVRSATDVDADLLVEWHSDPDVSRYWDGRTFTREEMLERLRRQDVEAFIIEADGRPIGYLQAWRDGDEGGIDMFLASDDRGRGLGPDAGRALARHLRDERGWPQVTVDPYTRNEPAIRAWRKAGFVDVEDRLADVEHSKDRRLMVWRG